NSPNPSVSLRILAPSGALTPFGVCCFPIAESRYIPLPQAQFHSRKERERWPKMPLVLPLIIVDVVGILITIILVVIMIHDQTVGPYTISAQRINAPPSVAAGAVWPVTITF